MKRKSIHLFDVVNTLIMVLLMVITVYPVIYVFSMSISDPAAVLAEKVRLLPIGFSLEAYRLVFSNVSILRYYANTVLYAAAGTLGMLLVTMLTAYALSRPSFFLKKRFTVFISVTMFFSGGLVPAFMVNNALGLYGTRWIMILPGMASAWNIIIARVYIKDTIGEALVEAAQIDGYNDVRILFAIIIPLAKPILAYLALGSIVGHWNSYFNALIYLPDQRMHPIQLFLMRLLIQNSDEVSKAAGPDYGDMYRYTTLLKYAAIMITMAPIMCVYPFLQKYFVKGIMIGSIKG